MKGMAPTNYLLLRSTAIYGGLGGLVIYAKGLLPCLSTLQHKFENMGAQSIIYKVH
jgi:hypothetical protein